MGDLLDDLLVGSHNFLVCWCILTIYWSVPRIFFWLNCIDIQSDDINKFREQTKNLWDATYKSWDEPKKLWEPSNKAWETL